MAMQQERHNSIKEAALQNNLLRLSTTQSGKANGPIVRNMAGSIRRPRSQRRITKVPGVSQLKNQPSAREDSSPSSSRMSRMNQDLKSTTSQNQGAAGQNSNYNCRPIQVDSESISNLSSNEQRQMMEEYAVDQRIEELRARMQN